MATVVLMATVTNVPKTPVSVAQTTFMFVPTTQGSTSGLTLPFVPMVVTLVTVTNVHLTPDVALATIPKFVL